MSDNALIKVRNVSFSYQSKQIYKNLTLDIPYFDQCIITHVQFHKRSLYAHILPNYKANITQCIEENFRV